MSLKEVLQVFGALFGSDDQLVHGKVERSRPTSGRVRGAYNLTVPSESDEDDIQRADTVEIECMDGRLSTKGRPRLFGHDRSFRISIAGGGVQPAEDRRLAVAKTIAEIHKANPRAVVKVAGHDLVCKGFDHFADGRASRARRVGRDAEHDEIVKELNLTINQAIRQGADPKRIRLIVDEIDEGSGRYRRSRDIRPRRR